MTYTIWDSIERAFTDLWADVIGIIPELVAALVVFVVGLIIASLLGRVTRKLVRHLQVDSLVEKTGAQDVLTSAGMRFTFSDVLGTIVKWFFILVFLNASAEVLGWTQIIAFVNDVLRYIPNVVVAVIIMAIGLIISQMIRNAVVQGLKSAKTPVRSPETLGSVARWAIVVFSVMAALTQLRVAEVLIQILFAALLFTLVIAFGLAGKDKAARFLDQMLS